MNLPSSIAGNVTVILSTRIGDDVRELCPRMAITSNGEVLLEGSPARGDSAIRKQLYLMPDFAASAKNAFQLDGFC